MKVILVEREKRVIKRVTRILHIIDTSIQIAAAVDDLDALLQTHFDQPFPDLVLINQQILGVTKDTVEARLTITTNRNHITYLAFRVNNLKQLQKKISNPARASHRDQWPEHTYNKLIDNLHTAIYGPAALQQVLKKRFLVTYQQKLLSVAIEEIAYFFSDNRFIFFKTFGNKKFLVEYRMDELESILDKQLFFRVNRSYIISIHSITAIYPHNGNRCRIDLNPTVENEMIVSRERFADFKKWLGE